MRFHLDEKAQQLGDPDAARRQFGNVEIWKDASRGMWGWTALERLWQDLRYGLRQLAANPGFTLLAVSVMATGIGANTAVFSVVNTVVLKPLAYRDPDRIVTLGSMAKTGGRGLRGTVSAPNFRDLQDQSDVFQTMAFYGSQQPSVTVG